MSVDLTTRYLGLELRSPLVASASPLTASLDDLRRLEQGGAGAVVLPSLFEELVEHEELELHALGGVGADLHGEATGYFPPLPRAAVVARAVERVARARAALDIPVIASLNGTSPGGWLRHARDLEQAGAQGLELNAYAVAGEVERAGVELEDRLVELVGALRGELGVPLAVKLSPWYSSLPHLATRLAAAGADGLVLFNRFVAPDIDLERMEVVPHVGLSRREELGLPLRWTAILRGRVPVSLAASGGVETAEDAVKLLLAGADCVMVASTLLRHGTERLRHLVEGLGLWLEQREYASVRQMQGSMSQRNCADPAAYERAHYIAALQRWSPR